MITTGVGAEDLKDVIDKNTLVIIVKGLFGGLLYLIKFMPMRFLLMKSMLCLQNRQLICYKKN